MCGIFGFAGKSGWRSSLLLQSLAIADEARGRHSTGLVVQGQGKTFILKKALSGREFVARGHAGFLFKKAYGLALGHNRFATTGQVTDRNAHPFGVQVNRGWMFGVHNGVIAGKERIAREYDITEPDVDSEAVFRAIGKMQQRGMSVVDAIESITEFISASADFAFVWLDTSEQAMYLWRSPDRPLCIIDARRLDLGRWFCSTPEIYRNAWNMVAGALGDISKCRRFEAKPYRLYRIADDGAFEVETVKDLRYRKRCSVPEIKARKDWWNAPSFLNGGYRHYSGLSSADAVQVSLFEDEENEENVAEERRVDVPAYGNEDGPVRKEFLWEYTDEELEREIFIAEANLDFYNDDDDEAKSWREYLTELHDELENRNAGIEGERAA